MKKQVKIVIGVVVAIAVIIAGISIFFPSVISNITSGTFGKADRYKKSQMTEADVKLRSEFTADTAKLKNMIQGLIYFSVFTQDMSNKIDSCVTVFENNGICGQQAECTKLKPLTDYSEFIRNNNKTLITTISMLTGFYLHDDSDESADVEKNLRDFGRYYTNLVEKDSVLEVGLRELDSFMLNNKTMKARKTEMATLKAVRDQIILSGIRMAALTQNKEQVADLMKYAIGSEAGLQRVCSAGTLALTGQAIEPVMNFDGSVGFTEWVHSSGGLDLGSESELREIVISAVTAGAAGSLDHGQMNPGANDLGFVDAVESVFTYNSFANSFGSLSGSEVNAIVINANTEIVGAFTKGGLNIALNFVNLGYLVQAVQVAGVPELQVAELEAVCSQMNVSAVGSYGAFVCNFTSEIGIAGGGLGYFIDQ